MSANPNDCCQTPSACHQRCPVDHFHDHVGEGLCIAVTPLNLSVGIKLCIYVYVFACMNECVCVYNVCVYSCLHAWVNVRVIIETHVHMGAHDVCA